VDGVEIAISVWFAGSLLAYFGCQFALFAWLSERHEPLDFMSLGYPGYLVRKYGEVCARESRPQRAVVPFMTLVVVSIVLSSFFFIGMAPGLATRTSGH
jgi:hypothetical protein